MANEHLTDGARAAIEGAKDEARRKGLRQPASLTGTAGGATVAGDRSTENAASGWQDISTAPNDGTAVWLWLKGRAYLGYCLPSDWLHKEPQWFIKASFERRARTTNITTDEISGCYGHGVEPSHWQPLPAPPLSNHQSAAGTPQASDSELSTFPVS